jgi:hypothetical protein
MNGELGTLLVGERFTVCLDDNGHPITRTVAEMTPAEVVAAIGHLADEAEEQPLAQAKLEPAERLWRPR